MTVLVRTLTAAAIFGFSAPSWSLGQNDYNNLGAYLSLREVGEGLVLGGSLMPAERIYALGSLAVLSEADINITTLRAGAGVQLPIEVTVPGLSFAADAALAFTAIEAGSDELTIELRGGAHYRIVEGLTAGAYLARMEGDRTDTYLAGDLRYRFQPQWQVHGGFDWSDNDGVYVGLEYLFRR